MKLEHLLASNQAEKLFGSALYTTLYTPPFIGGYILCPCLTLMCEVVFNPAFLGPLCLLYASLWVSSRSAVEGFIT